MILMRRQNKRMGEQRKCETICCWKKLRLAGVRRSCLCVYLQARGKGKEDWVGRNGVWCKCLIASSIKHRYGRQQLIISLYINDHWIYFLYFLFSSPVGIVAVNGDFRYYWWGSIFRKCTVNRTRWLLD